ncbi:MAG: MATE family efflux transporter [Clostridia bacterium]|nr:MATE family efflux transporter [Clostridia bacterium]
MQSQPNLGTEPIGRLLRRLAIPTLTAQLVNMLYNLIDRIYIGHIPEVGTAALTGLGVCMPIILLVSAFAALAAMGGAPRASIQMGKGDSEGAERIMGACATLLFTLSLVLTLVLSLWNEPLLRMFGASDATIGYATGYMGVYALGTVFVQMTLGLNAFITAQGFSRVSMITVLVGAALNTILDPIFIFAFGMGVQGAALATIISQAVSCLWVVRFLTGPKTALHLRRTNLRLDWKCLGPCVALGLAPFIMQSTESVLAICFNSSLLRYGGDMAVGTMTILTSIMQFMMMPLSSLSQAASPIISFNYGARNTDRVKQAFWTLLKSSAVYAAVIWTLLMAVPQVFVGLFTPDAALIAYAAPCVRIYMAASLLFSVQISCQQTFVALGNAKCSLFLACLRKLVLLIPLIYIMPAVLPGDKVTAVFLAEPAADFIAVTCTVLLFFREYRKLKA